MDTIAAVEIYKALDDNWAKFWMDCLTTDNVDNFLEVEMAIIERRNARELKARQERACADALALALTASGAHTSTPETETNLDAFTSVQDCFTSLGKLWEELLPTNEEHERQDECEIPRNVRCQTIEHVLAILRLKMIELSIDRSRTTCDTGLQDLVFDESGGRHGLWCSKDDATFRLNFCGDLSLVPSVGAMKIGVVDHLEVYVRSNCGKGPTMGFFSPAWKVDVIELNPDMGLPLLTANMDIKTTDITVSLSHSQSFLGKATPVKLSFTLPYLTSVGPMQAGTQLTRNFYEDEIWQSDKASKSYKSKVQERVKALKGDSTDKAGTLKDWKRVAGHLLG